MEKTYFNWTDNIKDWCISRQLWWGHRIPAYYCDSCGETVVARTEADRYARSAAAHILRRIADTLDTWFSSALWPFSTLGWPEKTKELEYFYPTRRAGNRLRYHLLLGYPYDFLRLWSRWAKSRLKQY